MAQSKRARNDTTEAKVEQDMPMLQFVVMAHFEDGEASSVRHLFAKVPRAWLEGIDTNFVSARVHNDCGDVSFCLLTSRDGDEAGDKDDDEADDKKADDKTADTPAYKLVERFVNVTHIAKAADLEQRPLWSTAEERLKSALRWGVRSDQERAINAQFMHKCYTISAENTRAYNQAQEAIKAMRTRLPELVRAKIEELRANNTLRQTMAEHDDAVSLFFAPVGCAPLDVKVDQKPTADIVLHITQTFS